MSAVPIAGLRLRPAGPGDAPAVAALHTDSWRRHYRGAYSDAYLDGDVGDDRLAVWTARLHRPEPNHRTIVAEDATGTLLGFAHTVLDDDPDHGSLLDNLHVRNRQRRAGLGTRLLAATADAVVADARHPGLYLWVLDQNAAAQAFYRARGGRLADSHAVPAPGGIVERLHGTPVSRRCVWPDARGLT